MKMARKLAFFVQFVFAKKICVIREICVTLLVAALKIFRK